MSPGDPYGYLRREYIQSAFMKAPLPDAAWEALVQGQASLGAGLGCCYTYKGGDLVFLMNLNTNNTRT